MSIYYNYNRLNSHNALFNFVITERGLGKSYGAKKMCVQKFMKGEGQFMLIRRYENELQLNLQTFWQDISRDPDFEGLVFGIKRGKKLSKFTIDGEVCGFAVALSTSSSIKSTPFPDVTSIVFDEFIVDKGNIRYLKNEVEGFFELYETVARTRTNVKAYFLGNAISSTNPYFSYDWGDGLHLSLPYGGSEFKKFKDGLILVNYAKNSAYREAKKETPFGKIIAGTKYSDYAIDNKWLRESAAFIGKKDGTAKFWNILILNGDKYGVWRGSGGRFWVSTDYDPNCPCVFTINDGDHNENTILIKARTSPWFKFLIEAYRNGTLIFEGQNVKNLVMPFIERCLTY